MPISIVSRKEAARKMFELQREAGAAAEGYVPSIVGRLECEMSVVRRHK